MKIDPDARIAPEKVRDYLLTPRDEGDKSSFFNRAGYTQPEWQRLLTGLREQILRLGASLSRSSVYGDYHTVEGTLVGPNGVRLRVVTVWITRRSDGLTQFVTAVPARRRRPEHDDKAL